MPTITFMFLQAADRAIVEGAPDRRHLLNEVIYHYSKFQEAQARDMVMVCHDTRTGDCRVLTDCPKPIDKDQTNINLCGITISEYTFDKLQSRFKGQKLEDVLRKAFFLYTQIKSNQDPETEIAIVDNPRNVRFIECLIAL